MIVSINKTPFMTGRKMPPPPPQRKLPEFMKEIREPLYTGPCPACGKHISQPTYGDNGNIYICPECGEICCSSVTYITKHNAETGSIVTAGCPNCHSGLQMSDNKVIETGSGHGAITLDCQVCKARLVSFVEQAPSNG